MAYFGLFLEESARMGPNEKEMLAPSHFAKVAAVSHGRVSWQTRRTYFGVGPLAESSLIGV
jgi:hypothetical protein